MKTCIRFFFAFGVFFSFSSYLNAQNIQVVIPSNAVASADELEGLYTGRTGVTSTEIETFYFDNWAPPGIFDGSCQAPVVEIQSSTQDDVTFDWVHVNGASGYHINVMRLSDGVIQNHFTTNDEITLNFNHDLFLVTFQTECSGGTARSPQDIIIIERPISFEDMTQNCSNLQLVYQDTFDTEMEIMDTYPNGWDGEKFYYTYINFSEVTDNAYVVNRILFMESVPTVVGFDDDHASNVIYNSDETVLEVVTSESSEIKGSFNFAYLDDNGYSLTYIPNIEASNRKGTIYLYRCIPRKRSDEAGNFDSAFNLEELSSSFNADKLIEYSIPQDEQLSLSLYSVQGQLMQTVVDQKQHLAGTYQASIDLINYPVGMYVLVMKTETQTIPLKLVRSK